MRRNILLGGVAGAVVGSWLTLIVVQLGEHGFSLPHRGASGAVTENRPATAPVETAKADLTPAKNNEAPKPIDTAKQDDTTSNKTQPEDQTGAPPAKPAVEIAPGSDVSKAAEDNAATAQPAVAQESKALPATAQSTNVSAKPNEAPPARFLKNTDTPSDQTSGPTEVAADKASAASTSPDPAPADQAKVDPTPDNRMPADQIDRQMAASEHQTLPPRPQSEQASLGDAQKPEEQIKPIELVRPFADQAGVLTIAGRSVQLTGIIPTDVDRMCTGPSGKSWPCGLAARTAFRMYLRGRTIDCDLPSATWQGTVKGACRYVRVDLSAWLVRFGWAEPEPGSPLAPLVDEAKQKQRGIYGDDPRKTGKSTLGPALPKEDPLNPI